MENKSVAESLDRRTRKPPTLKNQNKLQKNASSKVMLVPKSLLKIDPSKMKENQAVNKKTVVIKRMVKAPQPP
jgi:hypothetical protein